MIYIWKNEKRTGQGTFTWANGDKYVGEWKDGKEWNGTEQYMTKKETSQKNLRKVSVKVFSVNGSSL